jgi:dimeric dUTPase (all-alpha-NTP-PPase superfamily)
MINNFDFKIKQMLEMQNEMNEKVHPQWKEQDFPWYRAAVVEASEMLEHINYKWWKHQEPDMEQAKLELVDIWHFCLSDIQTWTHEDPVEVIKFLKWGEESVYTEITDVLDVVEDFQCDSLEHNICAVEGIPPILIKLDMTFDDLYTMYVAKNVLNLFRQNNGYKEGTYIKIWNGEEDNVVLMKIVNSLNPDSEYFKEMLYTLLEGYYDSKVLNNV